MHRLSKKYKLALLILHEDKPFKHIDTEDIWTEDNLFGNDDKRAVTDAVK